jgi:hypothetical protein
MDGVLWGVIKQASRRLFLFLDADGALRVYVKLLLAVPVYYISEIRLRKGASTYLVQF